MHTTYVTPHLYLAPSVLLGLVHCVMLARPKLMCVPECPLTATCVSAGSYTYCDCPQGKTGANCTMEDPCLQQTEKCPPGKFCFGPCEPNRVCMGATGEPHCTSCIAGWEGSDCGDDIDECSDVGIKYCLNGGTCINEMGDFRCACTAGWKGKECRCRAGMPCEDDNDQNDKQSTPTDETTTEHYPTPDNGNNKYTSSLGTIVFIACFVSLMT